jgi:P pilus assembly chaperone PapD
MNLFKKTVNHVLRLSSVGLALSGLLLFPSQSQAQVKVSPLVIETQAQRGQAQGMVSITNMGNSPSRVRVYAEPFTYKPDTGFATLPANTPNNLTPYLQFSPRELTIEPGQTRRVRIISRLAPNLPDGEYRAAVFNETLTEQKDASGAIVTLATRVGVTVYVTKGNAVPQLRVENASFNAQEKQLRLNIRNTGNASARPSVSWRLQRGNQVIKTGDIESISVIAENERYVTLNYRVEDEPGLIPGNYQVIGELVWSEGNTRKQLPFNVGFTVSK